MNKEQIITIGGKTMKTAQELIDETLIEVEKSRKWRGNISIGVEKLALKNYKK